jgi:aspartate aminotransferase
MMAPCSGFYSGPEAGKQQVRLAYVLEQPLLRKAVEVLRAALAAYPGRR